MPVLSSAGAPAGRIGVASQSGNFVSSFMNLGVQTGIGFSRGVSAGNAAIPGCRGAGDLSHVARSRERDEYAPVSLLFDTPKRS